MLGKTHMAVGVAAGLLVLQPKNLQELILGTGVSAIGSVISDIDVGTSESHKDADKIIGMTIAALLFMVAVECIWHVGIYKKLMRDSSVPREIIAAAIFLGICAFGKEQSHRSFMHSILALVLLTGCVAIFLPLAAPYFEIGFLSHLSADLLNRRGERLLYPWKKGFCLRLCSSSGIVNKWMFQIGILVSAGMFLLLLVNICFQR